MQSQIQQSRLKALNGYLIPSDVVDELVSFQVVEKILRESRSVCNKAEWIPNFGRRWFTALVYNEMAEFIPLLLCLEIDDDHLPKLDAKDLASSLAHTVSSKPPLRDLMKRFDVAKFLDTYREYFAPTVFQGSYMDGRREVIPIVATEFGLESADGSEGTAVIPRAYHLYGDTDGLLNKNGDLCVAVKEARPRHHVSLRLAEDLVLNQHIYESLATFQLGDDVFEIWCLPLPYGNLDDLWPEIHARNHDKNVQMWLIGQMVGIAEGLDFIHCGRIVELGFHGDIRPEHILWSGGRPGLLPPHGILQLEIPHTEVISDGYTDKQRDITMLCCVYLGVSACLILEWKDIQALLIDLYYGLGVLTTGNVLVVQERLEKWFSKLRKEPSCNSTLHRVISSISTGFYSDRPYPLAMSLRKAAHVIVPT